MQEQLQKGDGDASPMTKRQLEDMAKKLRSDDGVEALEKQLKELAKPEATDDAERERRLGDAERGGAQAQRGMGALPLPMSGDDSPSANTPGAGDTSQGTGSGAAEPGGAGNKHDQGTSDHPRLYAGSSRQGAAFQGRCALVSGRSDARRNARPRARSGRAKPRINSARARSGKRAKPRSAPSITQTSPRNTESKWGATSSRD